MTKTVKITGYVYKDENGDSRYDPLKDIPIVGATVKVSNKESFVTADDNGRYALDVSPGATYDLDVSLPTGLRSYDPDNGDWSKNHSTIKGQQTVNVPSNSTQQIDVDIAVKYSCLNYHPEENFTYRVWHSGPIFKGKPNTILVHGAVIPYQWHNQTNTNNCFPILSHLLQSKIHGQHNVWEFEYADQCKDTSAHRGCSNYGDLIAYGRELIETIKAVRACNPDNGVNIIAHSMGGLVARYALQGAGNQAINKIVTLDTGHLGFNFANSFMQQYSNSPVVKEVRPGSKFIYDLSMGFSNNMCKLLSLGTSNQCLSTLGVVSWTSSRLAQVYSDGGTNYDRTNTPFFIVDGVDHMSISQINNADHPAFKQIKNFFEGGNIVQQDPRSGQPLQVIRYFTVVLRNKPQSGYPKLFSNGTQIGAIVDSIDDITINPEYHAVIFSVDINPPYQNIQIEYAPNQHVEGQLTKRQSSIRLDVIPN